jgi:NAD(P)-dependent dehydrogenase (short-subunit alcohol dehydrogenase family)
MKKDWDVIVTGSEGYIGKFVFNSLSNSGLNVVGLDTALGNDLENEDFVINWFKVNRGKNLVNLFGLNDHVTDKNIQNNSLEVSLATFRDYLELNVTTLFSVCRNYIKNNDSGNILNFSSIYGINSPKPKLYSNMEKHIGYGVSKSSVIQLTKHLAVHYGPDFRANSVVLGGVLNNQSIEFVTSYSNEVPLGRMATREDVAGLVEFLVSEKAKYFSGSAIVLDGGWSAT